MALLALAFVGFAAWHLARSYKGGSAHVRYGLALSSLLPLALGSLLLAGSWKLLIERMSRHRVPTGPALALHLESQLARYTPGKVGLPLVRMAGAAQLGVTARTVGSSIAVETLSFLSVGGTLGFALLAATSHHASGVTAMLGRYGLPLLAVFAISTLALLAIDRRRYPVAILKLLNVEGEGPLAPARLPFGHLLYWSTWAAHGYLVSLSVGASHGAALASAGLYVLAPIVGFLALAAPAGAGVREAMLSVGLVPAVGSVAALAAIIISRAANLAVDVLMWGASRPVAGKVKT